MTLEEALLVADHGGDCKAALQVLAQAVRTEPRDCRTCRHHTSKSGGCMSLIRCVDGAQHLRNRIVQYWETT